MTIVDILLVEDNPRDVKMTIHALQKHNVVERIAVTRDGEEALEYIYGNGRYTGQPISPPRLILLDIKLPKIDGIEVLEKLKADPVTRRIPIVMLTSSREDQDLGRCYDLGVNSYIVKPVDFDQFNAAIQSLGLYWMIHNVPPQN